MFIVSSLPHHYQPIKEGRQARRKEVERECSVLANIGNKGVKMWLSKVNTVGEYNVKPRLAPPPPRALAKESSHPWAAGTINVDSSMLARLTPPPLLSLDPPSPILPPPH